jgi:hypothetical protein
MTVLNFAGDIRSFFDVDPSSIAISIGLHRLGSAVNTLLLSKIKDILSPYS